MVGLRFRIVAITLFCLIILHSAAHAATLANNGNGTVTDSRTGLVWQQGEPGTMSWGTALTYCEGLSLGGANDWRLPNVKELESLTDDSRYNPAIDTTYFPNANASYYWSSTTNAYFPDVAWSVYFSYGYVSNDNKNDSIYVRCVRGGQSGSLGTLSISDANGYSLGTQAARVSFPIRVTAFTSGGAAISGRAWLYGSLGMIAPNWVDLVNGVGMATVWLDNPGTGQSISASIQGVYGSSAPFEVTGSGGSQAKLSGYVTTGSGSGVAGATVTLGNTVNTNLLATTSGTDGKYSFTTAPPGSYFVQASTLDGARSGELTVNIANNKPVTMNLIVKSSNCNPDGLTPILLVPGIMGSTYYNGGFYPWLPKDKPDARFEKWHVRFGTGGWLYGLHDPLTLAGWRDLINDFKARGYEIGCTLFPVPYDWRMPIGDIADEYLQPAINRAKRDAGTQKVNIIAHSMGGLVARTYIDSSSDTDIDRFVMVGTPNHGSANAYYLWKGGDPRLLDEKTKGTFLSYAGVTNRILDFYEKSVDKLWLSMKYYPLFPYSTSRIRSFLHDKVKSTEQLMPTYSFLATNREYENGLNTWLDNLNSRTSSSSYFSDKSITAKIFAGNNNETIKSVFADGDGVPILALMDSGGDGTVLKSSAALPGVTQYSTDSSHSSLIGNYRSELVTFMTTAVSSAPARFASRAAAQDAPSSVGPTVGINVMGRVSPLLLDSSGKKTGINLITGLQETEITGATVSADMESAGISIENAADGAYTLTVGGEDIEDSWITVSYMDVDTNEERRLHHFNHAAPVSFTITVNSAGAQKLTVIRLPELPANLQANAIGTSSLVTKLSWSAVTTPGVTGYNVYSRRDDEPFLALIGTTAGTTFDTTDPWAIDDTVMTRLYAVAAIKADESESFLSDMAQNNDRDHDGLTDTEETALGTDPTKADTDGDGYSDFVERQHSSNPLDPASLPTVTLAIIKGGDGGGDVTVTNNGTSCGPNCELAFNLNTSIILTASPDQLSTFGGWTGCGSIGTSGECNVTMSAAKGVTVTFMLAPKAKIGTAGYSLLADSYTSAGITAEIWTLADLLPGGFLLDQDKAITLKGGWNAAYSSRSGHTVINGKLTIQKGSLRVDGVKVR